MKAVNRTVSVVLAMALVVAACGGADNGDDEPPGDTSPDTNQAASTSQAPATTVDGGSTDTTQPPETTAAPSTTSLAGNIEVECGIWEILEEFETPNEIADAIFGGDLDVEIVQPATIAACLGYNTWRSELILDGIEGDGIPVDMVTTLGDIAIQGNTVTSNERFLVGDDVYEARAYGEQTWLRGPNDDWFALPEGDGLSALGELQEHAETFGVFFTIGTLTAFALVGSIVYAPLATPGDRVDAGGVEATRWSVTPEAASEFARSLGADLPPSVFESSKVEYWVTDNGQIVRIDIAIPSDFQLPDAPEGSITYRLYDFGAPITIDPIEE